MVPNRHGGQHNDEMKCTVHYISLSLLTAVIKLGTYSLVGQSATTDIDGPRDYQGCSRGRDLRDQDRERDMGGRDQDRNRGHLN